MGIGRIIFGALVFIAIAGSITFGILGDLFWFQSVGYHAVFIKVLLMSVAIGSVSFAVFLAVSIANIMLARRTALGKREKGKKGTAVRTVIIVSALIGLIVAISMGNSWEAVLKYMNVSPFGAADPVFGMDTSFYVFTLPVYHLIINFLLAVLVASAFFSLITYVLHSKGFSLQVQQAESEEGGNPAPVFMRPPASNVSVKWSGSWRKFMPQLSVLIFLIFMLISARIWLARYDVLFSGGGAVFGAGYTDVTVTLPVLAILSVIALIIGVTFLANIRMRRPRFIVYGIGAMILIAILGTIVGGVMQALVVEPNEFNLERPYLERNIQATLAAYGLGDAEEKMFPVNYTLTASDIAANGATVNNIRLWDWRPLKQTYEQLQLFRTYYEFNDVDVDRYQLNGEYKQVLISSREMDTGDLPRQAQTWVNTHLVYTHGYGAVMNPVDMVSSEGLPIFYMKDIPATSRYIDLEEPRIYFGEKTDDYVITRTSTDELDYPSGDQNIYTTYDGTSGVVLSDTLRRLIYAAKLGSVELLVSGSLESDSKLLMYRNIRERVETIAPFLAYDPDPYIVTSDGRMFWVIDAYTTTDMYPYSEPVWVDYLDWRYLNYIRNSVKVVIDAYNGDVSYYVVDPDDPIIQTYRKIFPSLFKDFDDMPDGLKAHVRYPEGIFRIQAEMYSTYHMHDPRVFYNKEDVWVTPDEIYRGSRQRMQPYYIIMKLPEEDEAEFIMMIPFTPKGKENMIGWMAARSDTPNYGKLLVYQFSKQQLTYGPMQIEARIDQDTEISQLITLWSQAGSSVVRGNTLVIPIENSILYVEPLYLEATERGTLPQLQRVIAAYGDQLTMQDTLSDALNVIFGEGAAPSPGVPGGPSQPVPGTDAERLSRILELYNKAQEALSDGDLGLYQQYVEEIGMVSRGQSIE